MPPPTLSIAVNSPGAVAVAIGPLSYSPPSPVNEVLQVLLAAGDNVIAVPAGATWMVVQPPAGNAVALDLRRAAGDADGPQFAPGLPFVWPLVAGTASINLHAASPVFLPTIITFL